VQVAE